jgi:hypothetical protein
VTSATLSGISASADPAGSTPFFVPGVDAGDAATEREYLRLLACAEAHTGCKPADRRIQGLSCRVAGRDCVIEVGGTEPVDGARVLAIIELGRHLPFGVFTTAEPDKPALLVGPSVYSVTEFS